MKFPLLIILWLGLPFGGIAGEILPMNSSYSHFDTLLLKAQMTDKLVVLYANAKDCKPCSNMFTDIEKDEKLTEILDAFYLTHSTTLNTSFESDYLVERYKLQNVPAVLFLDAHGNVLAKLVGERKSKEVYRFAKKIQKKYRKE
ncbi:MAG: hypothetical protein KDC84_13270 [Crocinitomicaceae bacterium]|nr:hypothetical protein [Crocinitomicaceae bacterium]